MIENCNLLVISKFLQAQDVHLLPRRRLQQNKEGKAIKEIVSAVRKAITINKTRIQPTWIT